MLVWRVHNDSGQWPSDRLSEKQADLVWGLLGFLNGREAVWGFHVVVFYWDGSSVGTSVGFLVGWKQCGDFMGFLSGMEVVWGLHGVS